MLGEGRALDPNKYFIILTNLLANGLSSSPSNSPAPVERGRFPKVTIHDNVRLQHMLITEKLGIERLRLVTGFSMGACQTFQWAAQFPDMVRAACPIAGSARTGNFNKVFLLALRRALELDPAYADGFYERPPVNGLKAFAAIYAGWGTSEPFFREEAFRPLGSRSTAEHVADFWEPFFLKCDANNLLSQLWTWEAGDISANPTYGGDFEAALRAIKARTIIVPIDNDRYFPPVDSKNEARHIPGAKVSDRRLGLGPHGADEPGRHPGDRRPAERAAGRLSQLAPAPDGRAGAPEVEQSGGLPRLPTTDGSATCHAADHAVTSKRSDIGRTDRRSIACRVGWERTLRALRSDRHVPRRSGSIAGGLPTVERGLQDARRVADADTVLTSSLQGRFECLRFVCSARRRAATPISQGKLIWRRRWS